MELLAKLAGELKDAPTINLVLSAEELDNFYDSARKVAAKEAYPLFCEAAQRGHSKARYDLGKYYRAPHMGSGKDVVRAFMWYTLAIQSGFLNASDARERLSVEMTPQQITEAERLVAQWEPNPAECEVIAAEAGN